MPSAEEHVAEPREGFRLILGLGNPGERYAGTRHNRGRDVVHELGRWMQMQWTTEEVCASRVAQRGGLVLAMPETYMNRSGHAARCLVDRFEVEPQSVLVVYDDVSLPLGALRMRPSGGPGGQLGMSSVIESLRTDRVPRLRLGILSTDRDASEDLAEFVLSPFAAEEMTVAREQVERAVDACRAWFENGIETTMNRFNSMPSAAAGGTPDETKSE